MFCFGGRPAICQLEWTALSERARSATLIKGTFKRKAQLSMLSPLILCSSRIWASVVASLPLAVNLSITAKTTLLSAYSWTSQVTEPKIDRTH